jgi:hypothetical protein
MGQRIRQAWSGIMHHEQWMLLSDMIDRILESFGSRVRVIWGSKNDGIDMFKRSLFNINTTLRG